MISNESLIEFNMLPSRYIHESWLQKIEHGETIKRLKQFTAAEPYCSEYLLERFKLKDKYVFDPSEEVEKLIELDSQVLMEIISFTGAYLNARITQKVIERASVSNIRRFIGDKAYHFSLHRSPILKFPRVVVGQNSSPRNPGEYIFSSGTICFLKALRDLDSAISSRILLKLPNRMADKINSKLVREVKGEAKILVLSMIGEVTN